MKTIRSSHLALRFYLREWNYNEISECLTKGEIELDARSLDRFGIDGCYYRPKVGSQFDIPKLLKLADKVERWYDGELIKATGAYAYRNETDEQYLEGFDWG